MPPIVPEGPPTLQDILKNATKLSTDLSQREASVAALVNQMEAVHNGVLNAQPKFRSRIRDDMWEAVNGGQPPELEAYDDRSVEQLKQEHRQLVTIAAEQQAALDLIMSKYREKMHEKVTGRMLDKKILDTVGAGKDFQAETERDRARVVMKKAIALDSEATQAEEEQISRLRHENRGLREMLQISRDIELLPVPKERTIESAPSTAPCRVATGIADIPELKVLLKTPEEPRLGF